MKKLTPILAIFIILAFVAQAIEPILVEAAGPTKYDIEARNIYESRQDINTLLKPLNIKRDTRHEQAVKRDYVDYLVKGVTGLGDYGRSIVFFVTYGTPSTQRLGYRDRSGVLNSYKTAFNKLPLSTGDWTDILRIANGKAPASRSKQAEQKVRTDFRKIYNREPIMAGDSVALLIMAYGIRPVTRDLKRENAALARFKATYGYLPVNGYQWDILRAIAYSKVK